MDEKWTAGAKDKGLALTEEQNAELEKKLKKLNVKASLYGYEFHEVGDTWDMKEALLAKIGGDGKLEKAEGKITFQKIEEVNGHKCAKLLCEIHVISGEDSKINFKGEVTVWRSLQYFTDMNARGSLATIIEPVSDRAQIKVTGNSVITEDVSIKQTVLNK